MSSKILFAAAILAGGAAFASLAPVRAEGPVSAPAAKMREAIPGNRETAIFAGGCFWGVEGVFSHVKGVISATSGYTGGTASTAQYETVSTGTTGHAESVRVIFDPRQVNYADLLRIYFSVVADPTEVNRQGPDEGTQYRTALFPLSPTQASTARAYIAQLSDAHVYARPIATKLEKQQGFFPAEAYHQDFMARNPNYPYIVYNDRPKVEALKRMFPQAWKS
ncbi:methionine sulfoxide reductase A [Sphingobium yanoikuyae]|uniref:Peptide methionine sulfoxide reductase MsrA n=1 Tax=Sphingobium yanoikuyae TaxID=13690 RepID=A0A177JVW1_SPHYA|nr:peptide-methionine (S)-S-oxide reductase MsrA [Sphingobium yanoikuyae]OAH45380.1 methionine sulfoxide reductase A [Sphingobium yanoikuyae]